MAGGVTDFEDDLAELDALPIGERARVEFRLGDRRVPDGRSGRRRQLEMARQEVGVEVRFEHQLDGQSGGRGIAHILVDVTARIDDDRAARRVVADQIRSLRQAVEVVLREDHPSPSPLGLAGAPRVPL